jgi:hypothetical protein
VITRKLLYTSSTASSVILKIKKMQFSVFSFVQGNVNLLYYHIIYYFSSHDVRVCFAFTLHNIMLTILKYANVMKQLKIKNV